MDDSNEWYHSYRSMVIMATMTKEEQIEELAEWIVESMDVGALENYAKQQLEDYYNSPDGEEDFDINYAEMKEIKGDD